MKVDVTCLLVDLTLATIVALVSLPLIATAIIAGKVIRQCS